MDLDLKDKVVIISGATGAIGEAICKAFINEGSIVCPFYRKEEKYRVFEKVLLTENCSLEKVFPQQVDFKSTHSVESAVGNVISRHGKIDVLVNNVGKSTERPFLLIDEHEWEDDININLNVTARMIRIVLKQMFIRKSGAIINVSSLLSKRYGRGVSAYSAAKAGMDRLTQAISQEVGPKGIRINSVCPGIIQTDMSKQVIQWRGDFILEQTSLNRYGKPEEVANPILFLASENAASFITGHALVIDGGLGT